MNFKNNSTAAKEYFYDLNGNLARDLNKRITSITHNLLNLPQTVTIVYTAGQATNTQTYAANCSKLRTVQQLSGTNSKRTDYIGNVIYKGVNGLINPQADIVNGDYYIDGSNTPLIFENKKNIMLTPIKDILDENSKW